MFFVPVGVFFSFQVFFQVFEMAQAQESDSDTSYDPDNDSDISDSEDSLISYDDYDSDNSMISLEDGWSRIGVGVFEDSRPDPLPPRSTGI